MRSSAAGEDEPGTSHAGLYRSYLDVEGMDELLDRILRCLESARKSEVLDYRERRGAAREAPRMAVLVQRMVRAERAGVAFTVDPVGGRTDRMVVESVAGSGAPITSGRVRPDRQILARREGRIEGVEGDGLGPARARELGNLALAIEKTLGAPQDIEWAFAAGSFHMLQSRPAVPGPARHGVESFWTSANAQEALPDPVSPLTWSLLPPLVERGRRALFRSLSLADVPGEYLRLFHGRPYFNVIYFRDFLLDFPFLPAGVFDHLIFGGGGSARRPGLWEAEESPGGRDRPRPGPLFYFRLARLAVPPVLGGRGFLESGIRRFLARLARIERRPLRAAGAGDLLARVREIEEAIYRAFLGHVLGTALAGGYYELLGIAIVRFGIARDESLRGRLTSGLGETLSRAEGEAFEELVALARGDATLVSALGAADLSRARDAIRALVPDHPFAAAYARFLARFGHRAVGEADLANPRWVEDDRVVVAALAAAVGAPQGEERVTRDARLARERRLARAEAERSRVALPWPLGTLRRLVFRHLLAGAVRYLPYRENVKFHVLRGFLALRATFLELGRRLAGQEALARAEDVFFLTREEIESLVPGRLEPAAAGGKIEERRRERERWLASHPPLHVALLADGKRIEFGGTGEGGALAGAGASPGLAKGRARVVHDPAAERERLAPGEILVARTADVGWVPLFLSASGVVLECGGQLSHAAVVARELGIPLVAGVARATRAIPDGATVTVDGSLGRVYIEP